MEPAVAILRERLPEESLGRLLGQLMADKGISKETMSYIASLPPSFLEAWIGHHMIMHPHKEIAQRIQHSLKWNTSVSPRYQGTSQENRQIDASVWKSEVKYKGMHMRHLTWRGAAGAYLGAAIKVTDSMSAIRVLIIGAGPAGIMVARALINAGLHNVVLLDKTGKTGGVWRKQMLHHITQAVPFPLQFENASLEAGPRPGQEVTSFLDTLVSPPNAWNWPTFPQPLLGEVVCVEPGDLIHRVVYLDAQGRECERTAEIVINAIGVGEPLMPNFSGAMTTDVPPELTGHRWQEVWSEKEAERYRGKHIIFVSLSNATLSMLWQIHHWNHQKGMGIEYKVLTHYPESSIYAPHMPIEHGGRKYQLYRDLESFQLLRVAGDMHPFQRAFLEAREDHRIIPHVRHWTRSQGDGQLVAVGHEETHYLRCEALYTLIGYAPRAETLEKMGLVVSDRYMGVAHLDYDGEVQREPGALGRKRIWPGYFCLGIRNGYNDNEVLLPGILYRLPHVVGGVLLRAAEHHVTNTL
jgi:hypothetical protein